MHLLKPVILIKLVLNLSSWSMAFYNWIHFSVYFEIFIEYTLNNPSKSLPLFLVSVFLFVRCQPITNSSHIQLLSKYSLYTLSQNQVEMSYLEFRTHSVSCKYLNFVSYFSFLQEWLHSQRPLTFRESPRLL